MTFKYLNDKQWADITRDERFFCAHLYFEIKSNIAPFLQLMLEKQIINSDELDPGSWEAGFEVCFYRDYIFEIGEINGNKSIKKSDYSQKRTFDLCMFSEKRIIIIEAKAYTGFDTKQLDSFKEDEKKIQLLLAGKCPIISTVALVSALYTPRKASVDGFKCIITWQEMHDRYKNSLFLRANKSKIEVDD